MCTRILSFKYLGIGNMYMIIDKNKKLAAIV